MWKRSYGLASEALPDERGGNRYAQPTATAPHLDSTIAKQQQAESHLALLERLVLVKRHRLVSEIFRRCEETGVIKTKATAVAYSGTIPIQNMVLSPTSTSYLRAKVSLPSSPRRRL